MQGSPNVRDATRSSWGVLVCWLFFAHMQPAKAFDIDVVDQSVVRIVAMDSGGGGSTGTGFVINDGDQIATNHHVVEGAKLLFVLVKDGQGRRRVAADVVWVDEDRDLAVISAPGLGHPFLKLSTAIPRKHTDVVAVGFPGRADDLSDSDAVVESTVTQGVIERVFRGSWGNDDATFQIVQHSAQINSGNSGGPLLNACGEVVAVNTAIPSVRVNGSGSRTQVQVTTGIHYASHISSLVGELQKRSTSFSPTAMDCTEDQIAAGNTQVVWIAAGASVLALLAMILTLSRPRQRIVETYTQWVRRNPDSARRTPVQAARSDQSRSVSVPSVKPPVSTAVFELTGQTLAGEPLHVSIPMDRLERGVVLGRNRQQCDYALPDISVSRRHVKMWGDEVQISVLDLGSTAGTSLNHQPVETSQPTTVRTDGAEIQMGDIRLRGRVLR